MPPSLPPVETLPEPAPGVVRIRLASLDLLFQGPPLDPFTGSYDGLSGMDHLFLALKRHWGTNTPDVTAVEWLVPRDAATAESTDAVRAAIAGWSRAQMAVADNDLQVMAKERRRAWQMGGLFFAACFVIAAGLENIPYLSGIGGSFVVETIIIAGWVGVWHPLDLTLYAWWPLKFRKERLERTGKLQVRLLPDDTA